MIKGNSSWRKCHRIETSELLFTALARPMVLSIVLLLGALIAGTSLLRKARYKNASPERRLIMDVEMIKKSIRRQYADAFNDRGLLSDYVNMVPVELRPDLEKVFGVCYRILYGGGADTAVTPDEKKQHPFCQCRGKCTRPKNKGAAAENAALP